MASLILIIIFIVCRKIMSKKIMSWASMANLILIIIVIVCRKITKL